MMMNRFSASGAIAATVLAAALAFHAAAPAAAQGADTTGATAAEIASRFQKQKSRGLKIAPGTGIAAPAADAGTAAVADASAGTAVTVVPGGTAATGATVVSGTAGTALAAAPGATTVSGTAGTALAAAPVTGQGVAVAVAAAPVATAAAQAAAGAAVAVTDATVLVPVAYAELDAEDQVSLRIAFDFDSAVLRDSEKPKLAELCLAMRAVDVEVFQIVGHTDAAGSDAYNDRLSLLRAEEVKRHLVSDCGLPPERLQAVGVGKRYLADPADPRGESNRRVEFQALS